MTASAKNRVLFIQTVHSQCDDRVFYHQRASLVEAGAEARIFSSYDNPSPSRKTFFVKVKEIISDFNPIVVICDTPLAVWSAHRCKGNFRIVYDITEWYPSKKYLRNLSGFKRICKAFAQVAAFICALFMTDNFIFGEHYKSRVPRFLCAWKKYLFLPYYPNTDFLSKSPIKESFNEFSFFYAGNLSRDKGYDKVLAVVGKIADDFPEKNFTLNIVGRSADEQFPMPQCQNLKINMSDFLPFEDFCKSLSGNDIFLDLRIADIENTRCLPIKLFYYAAVGGISVYSDLKAIRYDVPDCNDFMILVNPKNVDEIVVPIEKVISDRDLFNRYSSAAIRTIDAKYNWQKIKDDFVTFITRAE